MIFIKKNIKFAKDLRKRSTETEDYLWRFLKAKRLDGYKFRRQEPISNYIVDFVCYEKKVIVECDGSQHLQQKKYDKLRDEFFSKQGYKILRFWDNQIFQNIGEVLGQILNACRDHPTPASFPSREGE